MIGFDASGHIAEETKNARFVNVLHMTLPILTLSEVLLLVVELSRVSWLLGFSALPLPSYSYSVHQTWTPFLH